VVIVSGFHVSPVVVIRNNVAVVVESILDYESIVVTLRWREVDKAPSLQLCKRRYIVCDVLPERYTGRLLRVGCRDKCDEPGVSVFDEPLYAFDQSLSMQRVSTRCKL
jgi:hypothetical protein